MQTPPMMVPPLLAQSSLEMQLSIVSPPVGLQVPATLKWLQLANSVSPVQLGPNPLISQFRAYAVS
jgi:hypothetical protein